MILRPPLPVWRSMMFVPANVERYVEKAHTCGADAIIVDLEDSIAPAEKAAARGLVQGVVAKVGRGGADVVVRINRPWRIAVSDIEAAVSLRVCALALPKVDDAAHIRVVAEIVDELEIERGIAVGSTRLIAMIETAEAFFEVRAIARAHPRVVATMLGMEDFSVTMGMAPEPEGLLHATAQTAIAARAAGVVPLGLIGTLAQFSDREAFRTMVRRAKALGIEGSFCIHPGQVPILNEEFAPTAAEVAHADRAIAAFDAAITGGRASAELDGRMIDVPVAERARRVLSRQAAIEARQRAMAAACDGQDRTKTQVV
ncbi:MAG TPA: CoA ester lyase [Planctomycetaceae bacterium]|nr:CoA ester lyase [Planctomycetaceae bacterium]